MMRTAAVALMATAVTALTACQPDAEPEPWITPVEVDGLFEPYVAGLDEMGGLATRNRFRELGAAAVHDAFPDSAQCHGAFSTPEGTWCYRSGAAEPFTIRAVDPFVSSPPGTQLLVASALRRAALELPAVPVEVVEATDLICVTFYVWHVDEPVAALDEDNLWGREDRRWADEISCALEGDTVSIVEVQAEASEGFELLDAVRIGGDRHLVVLRVPHEWSYLDLYRVGQGDLTLVSRLDPMELASAADSVAE